MLPTKEDSSIHSAFLSLPTEIRCHIYDYILTESQEITIGAAYVTVLGNRTQDRVRKTEIPGLPLDLTPVIRCQRDDSLLSVQYPPTVAIDNVPLQLAYPSFFALSHTCHSLNDELVNYEKLSSRKRPAQAQSFTNLRKHERSKGGEEGLSLYVSYPYGVLILKSICPFLLKQAQNVYISGYYTAPKISPTPAVPDSFNDSLVPSNGLTISKSFGTAAPTRSSSRSRACYRPSAWPTVTSSPPSSVSRSRLRLDPPIRPIPIEHIYSPFPSVTEDLAPTTLNLLVCTLFSPAATQAVKLTARILYPGGSSYPDVYNGPNSPFTHIMHKMCGGDIAMLFKRGDMGTGLCLTAIPKKDGRSISTGWENWVPDCGRMSNQATAQQKMLDTFLTGI